MSVRSGIRPLLVCSALFVFAHLASAQAKVAVINLQDAVFGSAEIKKADAQMQAKFKPRQDQMEALQKEIAALAQQVQGGKLTAQAEADIRAQGSRKERDLTRLQEDVQAESQAYRDDVLNRTSGKMLAVVKKLAEEKGIDLVVEARTTLYVKDALDLTKDAIAAYDKAYPAQ